MYKKSFIDMFLEKCIVLLIIISIAAVEMEENGQVEVRAVLIGCEPDDGENSFHSDSMRFEREELFKHSVLKDCRKKLALTVKSVSNSDTSGDEYIPIEHVFLGPNKRVKLLNPYVLRLRREPPVQAYKLHKIDRNAQAFTPTRTHGTISKNCYINNNGTPGNHINVWLNNRMKRQENDITEDTFGLDMNNAFDIPELSSNFKQELDDNIKNMVDENILSEENLAIITTPSSDWKLANMESNSPPKYNKDRQTLKEEDDQDPNKVISENMKSQGNDYDMYEIGNADLWYTIQVQLFEKVFADGKTMWNDLSEGVPARVGSLKREWTGPHMSVRFRSSQWIPRKEFTLPTMIMSLLAPVANITPKTSESNSYKYIVVPREDVIISRDEKPKSTSESGDFLNLDEAPTKTTEQNPRRAIIRMSRALTNDPKDSLNIVNKGSNQFLTLAHKHPYHSQVDLEARADGNRLVYVGSSGRLMTLVSDSSRQTRTVVTVQATNTGLAAARFRVIARNCNPELPELANEKVNSESDGYILLPPRHTRNILLDLPFEMPGDSTQCTVHLLNGDGQSVAVRDVTIRKGDRCFCIWHCECVCLGEDPKLLCHAMAEAQQVAAGLNIDERMRHVRSVCYQDIISLNICFTAFGAFIILLLCGLVKAITGLVCRCVGTWGLNHMVQMPRKLAHYYEPSLRDCTVVYDAEGWPLHPNTNLRTVRLISLPMEFILNIIFFVTVPCILLYDSIIHVYNRLKKTEEDTDCKTNNTVNDGLKDIQGTKKRIVLRRRRQAVERWMTPHAENLSTNLWRKGMAVYPTAFNDMRPLLHEQCVHGQNTRPTQESCGDSELDDTEYVLMQMKKSRDSLANSQRQLQCNNEKPVTE